MTQNSTNSSFFRQTTQIENARPVQVNGVEFLSGFPPDMDTNPKRIWVNQVDETLNFTVDGVDIHTLSPSTSFTNVVYPLIAGHRGAALVVPENTLISFDYAVGVLADIIECDVQATNDNQLYIMHDDTINRTTNLTGTISELRHDYVIQADAAFDFRLGTYQFPNTPVPSFGLYLDRYGGKNLLLPEVKDVKDSTAMIMANMVVDRGLQRSVMIQSFQVTNLQAVKAVDAAIKTMYLLDAGAFPTGAFCVANGIDCVTFNGLGSNVPTPAQIADYNANGILMGVYTIDTVATAERYIAQGVDIIITNDPAYLKQVVNNNVTLPYTWKPPSIVYGTNGSLGSGLINVSMAPANYPVITADGIGYTSIPTAVCSMCIGRKMPDTSYTINCTVKMNLANADVTRHFGIYFASDNDTIVPNFTLVPPFPPQNSYNFGYRQNGQVFWDKTYNDAPFVSQTSEVGAFPVILTGNVVPLQIVVTPTSMTLRRTDGAMPSFTVNDTEFTRDGFIGFYWSSPAVSFGTVTVTSP